MLRNPYKTGVQGIEKLRGYTQVAAAATEFDVGLGRAVEVAAAGYQQPVAAGEFGVKAHLLEPVTAVVNFNALQTSMFQ